MVLFNFITKGLNKAIAPKFLRLSLRIHEFIPNNAISLLPLSQRLVSIEVQDDYRQIGKSAADGVLNNASKSFDDFVERTWNVLGLERMVDRDNDTSNVPSEQMNDGQETRTDENDALTRRSQERVQLLGQYLLPTLTSMGSNPPQTFVKWIRGEYLIARYGLQVQEAIRKYPELKDDAAGLSAFDVQTIDGREAEYPLDTILPTVKTVRRAFDCKDWSNTKKSVAFLDETIQDSELTSIEDIIHYRLQGQIAYSGPLNAYFEMRRREDSYELWTKDYIFGLAHYLLQRIDEMNNESSCDRETVILDVGAGDGRLIYFLRRAIKAIKASNDSLKFERRGPTTKSSMPTLIASDDGSWRAPMYKTSHIQVEQMSADQAVEKYTPGLSEDKKRLIVLCSWMPPGEDWTYLFRRQTSTEQTTDGLQKQDVIAEEYILIGETDDGTCGHNWYTWGNRHFNPNPNDDAELPPHTKDGYTRVDLKDLSKLQFSRFDCKRSSESGTVSFRRHAHTLP
eukprot:scaffold87956_cov72-Cyclotella_meneghiniana.AAC.3